MLSGIIFLNTELNKPHVLRDEMIFMRSSLQIKQNINSIGIFRTPVVTQFMGAQWLSGRVLDSRLKGRGFEPHRRHCVVVLEQDTFILA